MDFFGLPFISWPLVAFLGLISLYSLSAVRTWYGLRKVAVPHWSAHFSYAWLGRVTFSGKQYWTHRTLHEKYGPLVRIGPKEVMTDDPEILRSMSAVRSPFTRGDWYLTGRFDPYHDNIFSFLDNSEHKKARARLSPGYSGRETSQALEVGVDEQINCLTRILRKKYATGADDAPAWDLGTGSSYFTMDVITKLAFGHPFGYLSEEVDKFGFLGEIRSLWPILSLTGNVPWLRQFLFSRPMLKLFGPKHTDKHGFGALMGVSRHYVTEKLSNLANSKGDILESFVRHGLDRDDCEAEGLFTIIAGSDSTATAIRSIFMHLVATPRVYQKLKREIETKLKQTDIAGVAQMSDLADMPYLEAVVLEGIHMRPPLLGLFPKVVPAAGAEFHGHYLPPGTDVCMNTSALLGSRSIFGNDPDVFRPERFIEPTHAERCKDMRRGVDLAFGHGQNQCLGKHIALMEMTKLTFELLRNFDFQLLSPWRPNENIWSYGVFLESPHFRVTRCEMPSP